MEIVTGTIPVPGLPDAIPVTRRSIVMVEHGSSKDSIVLRYDSQPVRLILPDIVRDIVWCANLDIGRLVLGSEYGHHVYVTDANDLRILRDLSVFRSDDVLWNRLGILSTPDTTRVVVLSDTSVALMTWEGDILLEQSIQVTDAFEALTDAAGVARWGCCNPDAGDLCVTHALNEHTQMVAHAMLPVAGEARCEADIEKTARWCSYVRGSHGENGTMVQVVWSLPDDGQVIEPDRVASTVNIYLHTMAGNFPCAGWDGEPLVLLADWLINATVLSREMGMGRQAIANHFLTGPYYFATVLGRSGLITLRFLRSYPTGPLHKLPAVTMPFATYRETLADAAQALLAACHAAQYGNDDELGILEASITGMNAPSGG